MRRKTDLYLLGFPKDSKAVHLSCSLFASFLFSLKRTILLFIVFLAAPGLRCIVQAFSSGGEWGLLVLTALRLLIVMSSLVEEHRL